MRPEARLKSWLQNRPREATCDEALEILRLLNFDLRRGGRHHWIAINSKLAEHPQFPNGVLTISCHHRGRSGSVHPSAIQDIVKAAKFLGDTK